MKEIAELKKEIREQIEKEKKYASFEDTQAYKDTAKIVGILIPFALFFALSTGIFVQCAATNANALSRKGDFPAFAAFFITFFAIVVGVPALGFSELPTTEVVGF